VLLSPVCLHKNYSRNPFYDARVQSLPLTDARAVTSKLEQLNGAILNGPHPPPLHSRDRRQAD
jgi:hypothetical protein